MRSALILTLLVAGALCSATALPRTARASEELVEDEADETLLESHDRSSETENDGAALEDDNQLETADDEVEEIDKKIVSSDKPSAATEIKVMLTGNKRRKTKNSGPSKKLAAQLLPLFMIPVMIQAQLIPMMLIKLKLMALKALMLGKAALLIVLFNLVKNAFIGADSMEEQYEQQSLASGHYGYSGVPEYGAWINKRRVYQVHNNGPYRAHDFEAENRSGLNSQTAQSRPHLSPKENANIKS